MSGRASPGPVPRPFRFALIHEPADQQIEAFAEAVVGPRTGR